MDLIPLPPEGAGGGRGGQSQQASAPIEEPNTLRSRMRATVLYLVSEGPIKGLVDGTNGLKCIYLNDTAVMANDGSMNLSVGADWRLGDASQSHIAGIPSAEASFAGPGLVRKVDSPPAVRTLDMTGRDRWSVNITVRSLYLVDANNNIGPNSVEFRIEWRVGVGAWNVIFSGAITGKCVAPYVKQYKFGAVHNGPVDVRVIRISDDPADSRNASEIEWSGYSVITDQKMMYPNAAYFALVFDAEKYPSGLPTATFDIEGLLCEIPSNYNPTTRAYTGVWDGTFIRAYTDNPAWIFWTLATDPRFGAGTALSAGIVSPSAAYAAASGLVDRWVLYSIAQYCDESVPDGLGGFEPRYTFNAWINSADEAYRVLSAIASAFRGMIYWGRGQIVPVIDRPTSVSKLVTPANVIDGLFRYEGSALRARHSVVRVRWRDPAQGYREAVEVVEDPALMAEVGIRSIDYEAVGCTKRSMARRMGRWILYTERYENGTVSYLADLDHANVMPGEVIHVQDPNLAGVSFSGRLARGQVAAGQLDLDREVTFTSGITYSIRVVMANGAISAALPITNSPGTTATVTVSSGPAVEVLPEAVWMITATNVAPVPYRVLAVEETEDQQYAITALRHYPGKFDFIENGLSLADDPYTIIEDPTRPLAPPTGLAVQEFLAGVGSTALVRVILSWTPPTDNRIRGYEAQAITGDIAVQSATTRGSTITFVDLTPGSYVFRVRSQGSNGEVSAWVATTLTAIDGVNEPPGPPSALSISSGIRRIALNWTNPAARFLRGIEVFAVGLGFNNASDDPYASLPTAPSFGSFTKIGEVAGTSFIHDGLLPSHVWYYYVRAIDIFGTPSTLVGPIGARTSYLVAADIRDGIINTAKFAASIAPVNLIPNLSATGADGDVAFNTDDQKLYKRVTGAWVPIVRTEDLAGQIAAGQIAANAVVAGKVAAGAIRSAEIASGEIRANHLAAEEIIAQSVQVADLIVGTTKITGNGVTAIYADSQYKVVVVDRPLTSYYQLTMASVEFTIPGEHDGKVVIMMEAGISGFVAAMIDTGHPGN